MTTPPSLKLWLDITTLYLWQNRPAVGIVRTEREICRRFVALADVAVRFCYFDKRSRGFIEIDRQRIAAILSASPKSPGAESATATPETVEQRLQRIAFKAIKFLPAPMRLRSKIFLANQRQRVVALAQSMGSWRRGLSTWMSTPARPAGKRVRFSNDEIYLSMGLDWDHKDLDWLYREKRERGFKSILFCYDLIPYKFPQLYSGDASARFAKYFANLAWCADTVCCISEHTQRDLLAFLDECHHARRPACEVLTLGCDTAKPDAAHIEPAVAGILSRDFVLYVSTIERRKNHEVLYRAIARMVDAGRTDMPLLVFVGMRGWGVDDLMKDIGFDPRVQGRIVLLDRVNDDELNALYERCLFTVFPSLYEGWGLPVAESLAHGKFCLASDTSSIPEAGGDLVEYLDPWDLPAWTDRLAHLFSHPAELASLNERVRAQYRAPTWDQAAAKVLECARRLTGEQADADRR